MWGGRFSSRPAEIMQAINVSIGVDQRLLAQDLAGSRAHCRMLAKQGVIQQADADAILGGLDAVEAEILDGTFPFREQFEDIHMNVEARLNELIGEPSGRLHTARSRNDQVALDFRLWVRDACDRSVAQLKALQSALLARAEQHAGDLMPGFTHLQTAQPVTFGHHCMAYVEMFGRDRSRVRHAIEHLDESPIGAAALAGTGYPIDRHMTAKALGFREPTRNSIDTVSDRDFAIEFLAIAAICAVHLSRLAEEINLSVSPAWERVRKLEEAGLVKGYRAVIDWAALFKTSQVLVEIALARHTAQDMRRFEQRLLRLGKLAPVTERGHHAWITGRLSRNFICW